MNFDPICVSFLVGNETELSNFSQFWIFAGAKQVSDLGLWGNYSVPADNPFAEDKELQPEIWALGFRNPWRCSFDAERPSYFLCADVGQVSMCPTLSFSSKHY